MEHTHKILIEHNNRLEELNSNHKLILISDSKFTEEVFMVVLDGEDIGYIVYEPTGAMIKKFEIVSTHQGKGYGQAALKAFLRKVTPFSKCVYIHPIKESLYTWYEQVGFKKISHLMKVDL